ncbi:hypothetical protein L228DRAFT_262236 [Xylona heveae TC161]|uniref:Uncharacterized protein n=1 Tax=Xylona heveae (strain CBS 132557 / TC161) TaxID=1328760 RepID=A0A165FNF1_XYLHT|nr:hypothetical protein L228DRAFT_262236 [Xylona heveae TC161]KZF21189.1 hypothetical protein L228DRAFT_262236 [Xylona heveae TC161]
MEIFDERDDAVAEDEASSIRLKPCILELIRTEYCVPSLILLVDKISIVPVETPQGPKEAFKLWLSDGEKRIQAILRAEMHRLVVTHYVREGSFVRLEKYQLRKSRRLNGDGYVVHLAIADFYFVGQRPDGVEGEGEGEIASWELETRHERPKRKREAETSVEPAMHKFSETASEAHSEDAVPGVALKRKRTNSNSIQTEDIQHQYPVQYPVENERANDLHLSNVHSSTSSGRSSALQETTSNGKATSGGSSNITPSSYPSKPPPPSLSSSTTNFPADEKLENEKEKENAKENKENERNTSSPSIIPTTSTHLIKHPPPPPPPPSIQPPSQPRASPLAPSTCPRSSKIYTLSSLLTHVPYRQNYKLSVVAIIDWVSPHLIKRPNMDLKRDIRIVDPTTTRRVLLSVYADPEHFTPAVGTVALFRHLRNHKWEGASLNAYKSDCEGKSWFVPLVPLVPISQGSTEQVDADASVKGLDAQYIRDMRAWYAAYEVQRAIEKVVDEEGG